MTDEARRAGTRVSAADVAPVALLDAERCLITLCRPIVDVFPSRSFFCDQWTRGAIQGAPHGASEPIQRCRPFQGSMHRLWIQQERKRICNQVLFFHERFPFWMQRDVVDCRSALWCASVGTPPLVP
jgi:hypothetical protein